MTRWRKSCLKVIAIVSILQLAYYLLSSHFNYFQSSRLARAPHSSPSSPVTSQISSAYRTMQMRIMQGRVTDSSGQFFIVPHVVQIEPWLSEQTVRQDVGLVSQCSLSQLHYLSFLAKRWAASLSIAVFVMPAELAVAIPVLAMLRTCHDATRKHAHFHLVFPAQGFSNHSQGDVSNDIPTSCQEFDRFLRHLKTRAQNYGGKTIAYPNNLLRNVARRYSDTEYTLVIDIDMVPNEGLRDSFLNFSTRTGLFEKPTWQKIVYVIPVYEISEQVSEQFIPRNKKELLDMIEEQEARPFYIELCWRCQKVTDYAAWERSHSSSTAAIDSYALAARTPAQDQLTVLRTLAWKVPYEPFYIGRHDVPLYDERFTQYGFNRISQVCETHVAGYDFAIRWNQNDAFLVHRGLKRSDSFHADKKLDQERNRILFREFKESLKRKYPTGTRSCN